MIANMSQLIIIQNITSRSFPFLYFQYKTISLKKQLFLYKKPPRRDILAPRLSLWHGSADEQVLNLRIKKEQQSLSHTVLQSLKIRPDESCHEGKSSVINFSAIKKSYVPA
jgi:hypothetical protein